MDANYGGVKMEIEKETKKKVEEEELKVERKEIIKETAKIEPLRIMEKVEEGIRLEPPSFSFEGIKVGLRELKGEIKLPEVGVVTLPAPSFEQTSKVKILAKELRSDFILPKFLIIDLSSPSFDFLKPSTIHYKELSEKINLPLYQQIDLSSPHYEFCLTQRIFPSRFSEETQFIKPLSQVEVLSGEGVGEGAIEIPELSLEEFPFDLKTGEKGEAITHPTLIIAPGIEDGFEAIRKLFILELEDRGRDPSPLILHKKEIEGKEKEEILRLLREYRHITIDGYENTDEIKNEIKEVIKGKVEGSELKYIILKLSKPTQWALPDNYREIFGTGRVILVKPKEIDKQRFIQKIASVFNASFKSEGWVVLKSLDELCFLIEGEKDEAIKGALISLLKEEKLPKRPRLPLESDEHYAMTLLTAKKLSEMGKRVEFERFEPEALSDHEVIKENERVILEFEVFKRLDILAEEIGVECETLKNLNDPLSELRKKAEKIKFALPSQTLKEIWFVFPYRKVILYGRRLFESLEILPIPYKIFIPDFSAKKIYRLKY